MSLNDNRYVFLPTNEIENLVKQTQVSNVELKSRVRQLIRVLKASEKEEDLVIPGFQYIIGRNTSIYLRIAWLFIFFCCFAICGYQTVDRIRYYYTYPTIVDLFLKKNTSLMLPSFTICSQATKDMLALVEKDAERIEEFGLASRLNYLRAFLGVMSDENTLEIVPADLWKATNISKSIVSNIIYSRERIEIPRKTSALTAYGECVSFHSDRPIKYDRAQSGIKIEFSGKAWLMPTIVAFHQPDEYPNLREILVVKLESRASLPFSLITYEFLNTPVNPCVSNEEIQMCYHKCLLDAYKKNNLTCKLPFYPAEFDLPPCTKDVPSTLHDEYVRVVKDLLRLDPVNNCKCTKSCRRNYINWFIEDREHLKNLTEINYYYEEDTITYFVERYEYTLIGLFCDIGGNLGLYTGLSVLSIFELMQNLYLFWMQVEKQKKTFKIPLCKQVSQIMKDELRMKQNNYNQKTRQSGRCNNYLKLRELLKLIILTIIIVCTLYLIYSRIVYYFTYPVAVSLDVLENSTIYFPNFIFCFETKKLLEEKRKYSKKLQRDNWCEMDMLDLLDVYDAEVLWKKIAKSKYDLRLSIDYGRECFGFRLLEKLKKSEMNLPYGNCIFFEVSPQIYSGSITALTSSTYVTNQCGNTTIKFLLASGDKSDVHYFSELSLPTSTTNYIFMQVMQHHLFNAPNRPCVSSQDFLKCKKECLEKKLLPKLKCRLPFIPFDFLPTCKTPTEAKAVTNEYLKIYSETDVTSDAECSCTRQCDTVVYNFNLYPDPPEVAGANYTTAIMFTFGTNLIRKLSEIPVYDFIKFICELGGIIGLALGASILQIIDMIQILSSLTYNSHKKPKFKKKSPANFILN